MKKLHASFMKDLRNIEFAGMYKDIIKQMQTEQVDDGNIKTAFEKVETHKERLLELRSRERNKFSLLNKRLTRMRSDYLISLRLRVESYKRSHILEERVAAEHIYLVIRRYDKKYYAPNITSQTVFVDDIVFNIKQDKNFREAFIALNLKDLMDTIAEMSEEITNNFSQRISDNGENKERRKGVRKAAYQDMKIMIDAINFELNINRDNEEKRTIAEGLIQVLDSIFKDYRTPMKSRNTKRRNKEEVNNAVKELIRTQQEHQKMLTMGASGGVELPLSTKESMGAAGATPAPDGNEKSNSDDSSITKKERGKGEKGDDGKLPSINKN